MPPTHWLKQIRIICLCLLLASPLLGLAQRHKDTLHHGDTLVIRTYKKTKLHTEEYYLNGELIAAQYWSYYKTTYGYSLYYLESKPWLEYRKEFYWDGQLKIESVFKKGKKHGYYNTYYPNGKQQCDCNFSNGKEDSLQTIYFDNGQIWTQRIYKNGKPWSVISNYDSLGHPLEKGSLKDGNGTLYLYDEKAVLIKIEHYKNGKYEKVELLPAP